MLKALIMTNELTYQPTQVQAVLNDSGQFTVDMILDYDTALDLDYVKQYDLFIGLRMRNNRELTQEALAAGIPGLLGMSYGSPSLPSVCKLFSGGEDNTVTNQVYSHDDTGLAPMPGTFQPYTGSDYIGYFASSGIAAAGRVLCARDSSTYYATAAVFDKGLPNTDGVLLGARAAYIGTTHGAGYTPDGAQLLINVALWVASNQSTVEGKVKAHDGTPLTRMVRFIHKSTGLKAFDVMSDAAQDGLFSAYAPPGLYTGIAYDEFGGNKNAVVLDDILVQ
jgi:hypothetical protein